MSRPKSFLALIGAVAALGSDTPFSVDNNSKPVRMSQPLCSSHTRTHDQHRKLKIHAALLACSASSRTDKTTPPADSCSACVYLQISIKPRGPRFAFHACHFYAARSLLLLTSAWRSKLTCVGGLNLEWSWNNTFCDLYAVRKKNKENCRCQLRLQTSCNIDRDLY